MFLSKLIITLFSSAEQRVSLHLSEQATHHLDARLLADMGLYREHGRLYLFSGIAESTSPKATKIESLELPGELPGMACRLSPER